jgi:hypothetical protein
MGHRVAQAANQNWAPHNYEGHITKDDANDLAYRRLCERFFINKASAPFHSLRFISASAWLPDEDAHLGSRIPFYYVGKLVMWRSAFLASSQQQTSEPNAT